jgi:hypothetical protein
MDTFWSENLKGTEHSENLGADGSNIRTDLGKIGWEGVNWIRLPQDSDP